MGKTGTSDVVIERGLIVLRRDSAGAALRVSFLPHHYRRGTRSEMRRVVSLFCALLFAVPARAEGSGNPTHDRLLALPRAERVQTLAKSIGQGCVGVSAFPMGVTATGKAKGLAYWSVRCKDGRSFALQIAPDAQAVVVDCRLLQANGKECFKKF